MSSRREIVRGGVAMLLTASPHDFGFGDEREAAGGDVTLTYRLTETLHSINPHIADDTRSHPDANFHFSSSEFFVSQLRLDRTVSQMLSLFTLRMDPSALIFWHRHIFSFLYNAAVMAGSTATASRRGGPQRIHLLFEVDSRVEGGEFYVDVEGDEFHTFYGQQQQGERVDDVVVLDERSTSTSTSTEGRVGSVLALSDHSAVAHVAEGLVDDEAARILHRVKYDGSVVDRFGQKDCSICFEMFQSGVELLQMPCMHIFHDRCLEKWFERSRVCPLCRYRMPAQVLLE